MKERKLNTKTLCVHAGQPGQGAGPVVNPIYATSTFKFRDAQHGANLFSGKESGYIYTRMGNPTVKGLEDCVATLEGGAYGLATSSGMAATNTTVTALCSAGDHIICSAAVYGPTNTLLTTIMSRLGVEPSIVDTADLDAVKAAFKPNTKVLFVETPGNPTLVISDIAALADIAHRHNALLVVDNTFMSPILQQPLMLGADIVVHSMTKFLNGHADVVAGIIVVKDEKRYKSFRSVLNHLGGVLPPFEAFLVHRGIRTLLLRMKQHCENGRKVALFLENHPKIEWVRYPGLPSHPQYELARRQMKGPGGMVSFELKGGLEAGRTLMNSTRLCALAVSLGGVESLIQHPASMTHAGMAKEARLAAGITDGLVRISVGIEDADDIISDLDQALAKV
ncbi:methionine gamma-lyase [candidate division WOR-3 bacterium JGI_Cruoil_03_51_56]|uniref:L-methionine gamma-lyase n=1 Tax=candidate division WOR-3 bacterium JGI_Cruoil_03_51_56 TaxID=1973747 RepID=A0A235BNK9_UNCW3|nr:MAG: methionine gamma-lyase [candidate division WOR-3 bacterium JGI_Cruoil_03_51_56]